MNTVERVKLICKERGVTISKLEKDLRFANGYLGQLRRGTLPDDRLNKIAEYLEISPKYLSTGILETSEDPDMQMLLYIKSHTKTGVFNVLLKAVAEMYYLTNPDDNEFKEVFYANYLQGMPGTNQ